ncbi:ParB N-terminal domain-containing protein [Kibdelosporangium persicum]|uniref:Streptomycin biosynthesis operon regulator n=1 Tax=Kibdelosporangium persicum TaxID=2698649 RepID=A0ABX2FI71_9PSEU|nr:ParB N-terminal domain-containing protein [Kibdelosporangium persicum]NRN70972.1 Streptomycin biosynthesis operon regulator [Kibdelosporangium persicum]
MSGDSRQFTAVSEGKRRTDRQADGRPHRWLDWQLSQCETGRSRIDSLLPAHSPRVEGVVDKHVKALAESPSPLPPIIVHRPTMRVVDGMHRMRAAVLRGHDEIDVYWYDGDEIDAFAVAVRHNTTHGLPLSLADRRIAAARIIESHPNWSDRMIATIVNLAATTVRGIRARSAVAADESEARIGIDGRLRRLDTADRRRMAARLLKERPGSSLREIAGEAGLAPSTVLDVRRRIRDGLDPVPLNQNRAEPVDDPVVDDEPEPPPHLVDELGVLRSLRRDPALRFTDTGRTLLRWLEFGPVDADARTSVAHRLPPHCLDVLTVLASRRAAVWQDLADQLKKRSTMSAERRSG